MCPADWCMRTRSNPVWILSVCEQHGPKTKTPADLFMIPDPFSYGWPNPGADRSALTEPVSIPSGLSSTTLYQNPALASYRPFSLRWQRLRSVSWEDHFSFCLGLVDAQCAFSPVLFTDLYSSRLAKCSYLGIPVQISKNLLKQLLDMVTITGWLTGNSAFKLMCPRIVTTSM